MKDRFQKTVDDYIDELVKDSGDLIKSVTNSMSFLAAQAISSESDKIIIKADIDYEVMKPNLAERIIAAKKLRDNPELGNLTEEEKEKLLNGSVKLSDV